jgi:hypothetical protein
MKGLRVTHFRVTSDQRFPYSQPIIYLSKKHLETQFDPIARAHVYIAVGLVGVPLAECEGATFPATRDALPVRRNPARHARLAREARAEARSPRAAAARRVALDLHLRRTRRPPGRRFRLGHPERHAPVRGRLCGRPGTFDALLSSLGDLKAAQTALQVVSVPPGDTAPAARLAAWQRLLALHPPNDAGRFRTTENLRDRAR